MIRCKFCMYWGFSVFVNNERPWSFFRGLSNALQNCEFLNNYIHLQSINEWMKQKRNSYSLA